jgi:hypothetical protein
MPYESNPSSLDLGGGVHIFTYAGDPNAAQVSPRDAHYASAPGKNESLALASLGSVCIDPTTGLWWVKREQPGAGPTGIWVSNTPGVVGASAASAPTGAAEVRPTAGKPAPTPTTTTHGRMRK